MSGITVALEWVVLAVLVAGVSGLYVGCERWRMFFGAQEVVTLMERSGRVHGFGGSCTRRGSGEADAGLERSPLAKRQEPPLSFNT